MGEALGNRGLLGPWSLPWQRLGTSWSQQPGTGGREGPGQEPSAPSQHGLGPWSSRPALSPWPVTPPPQQLDPENTGFIGADTFAGLVHSHELPLDPAKLDMLVALAQSNERGQVCYQELVDLVSATGVWATRAGLRLGQEECHSQSRVGRGPPSLGRTVGQA
jgi:rhomboid-related protein 1/2/3